MVIHFQSFSVRMSLLGELLSSPQGLQAYAKALSHNFLVSIELLYLIIIHFEPYK